MPMTPGTYEFRLFLNNGYTRAATSPPITVTTGVNPVPVLDYITPSAAGAGMSSFTFRANGSSFLSSSVVRWNAADRPTTYLAATSLQVTLNASDLAAVGTGMVTVFTPGPGGGSSSPVPFTIVPAPILTVSATSVSPGAPITVTMTGGLDGPSDWIALAPTTAPDTTYVSYLYVKGVNGSWTFT